MKHIKQPIAAALAALLLTSLTATSLAEGAPSEKEEVIYILTDASGKVTDIEAVNIFSGGSVTDYGDYAAVKILNTTDKISQSGDRITFSSDAGKVYYQGTMKTDVIPWNISIRYFLDGKEYSADELAGKSGALEIRFSVSKNENCPGSFYEDYALQITFTLDTELCRNIVSSGATAANIGSDKQLTYTILPGKGLDTRITADVRDFEMDSVAINGVRLHMNIEVDDAALRDKVEELVSAIDDLNDGAEKLLDGSKTLSDATGTLNGKVGELHSGVGSLADGSKDLSAGLTDITANSQPLTGAVYSTYEGLFSATAEALNSQLRANGMEPVALTPSTYAAVLTELVRQMEAGTVYQKAYESARSQVSEQVSAQADALYLGYLRSQEDSIYQSYIASQADTLYGQAAAQALYEQLLQNGYSEEQAAAYLGSAEGQSAAAQAAANLTDEQKKQILEGALLTLSDEQKSQIRDAYTEQLMASDEVAAQIQAVASAAAGANTLALNMDTLYGNTGTLQYPSVS